MEKYDILISIIATEDHFTTKSIDKVFEIYYLH